MSQVGVGCTPDVRNGVGGLADRGHDVDAVIQRPDLMALHDDEPILAAATADGRIMVTTNIGDFAVLDARWAAKGRTHAGMESPR